LLTTGFGIYTRASAPLAIYDTKVNGFEHYNNQFVFHIAPSFNLQITKFYFKFIS
jgi:hypothetical protein